MISEWNHGAPCQKIAIARRPCWIYDAALTGSPCCPAAPLPLEKATFRWPHALRIEAVPCTSGKPDRTGTQQNISCLTNGLFVVKDDFSQTRKLASIFLERLITFCKLNKK